MESTEFVVYPARSGPLVLVLSSAAVVVACVGWFANRVSDLTTFGMVVGLLVVVASIFWLSWAIRTLQETLGPRRPLFRLDSNGIECALGQISWSEVERADIVGYLHEDNHGETVTEDW